MVTSPPTPPHSCILFAAALLAATPFSPSHAADWYLAPSGLDANPGTSNAPFATIMRAQIAASFGDTVWLRGGTYLLNNSHLTYTNSAWASVNRITKNGIRYAAVAGERPVFDFTDVKPPGWRVTAFLIDSDDCVFEGFDVVGVQVTITNNTPGVNNTQSECFRVDNGNRNRFERLAMHDGMGIGWHLVRGQSNLVLNCDAYNNRGLDSLSMGNVDGFGIHGTSTSHTGNVLSGCRAWFNTDDGFDLINCDAPAVIENCWAFYNGYFTNFASSGGDGNGFKSGGYGRNGSSFPTPVPRHVTRFCLAVRNRVNGFYANHHTGGLDWIGNTAYRNNRNYNLLCTLTDNLTDVQGYDQFMRNNLGYLANNAEVFNLGPSNDVAFNYFTMPVTVATDDFMSLVEALLTAPRRPDGELPYLAFAQLTASSDLMDAGTNAGFAFVGAAPDLGAFERGIQTPPTLAISRAETSLIFSGAGGPAGGTNFLIATTNIWVPVSQWSEEATGQFDITGGYAVTNPLPANLAGQIYRLRLQ